MKKYFDTRSLARPLEAFFAEGPRSRSFASLEDDETNLDPYD